MHETDEAVSYSHPYPSPAPWQSLRNFAALTTGETFRILYNKKKYDIGVVEVRGEAGAFAPGAAQAVCIIEVRSPPFLLCCHAEHGLVRCELPR